jgi:putative DNA primase/helicase
MSQLHDVEEIGAVIAAEADAPAAKPLHLPEKIKEGQRGETIRKLLRSQKARGISFEAATATCDVENRLKCDPPLTDAALEYRRWWDQPDRPGFGERASRFPETEAGDAECFADLHQEQVRYDHRRERWLVSDETSGIWVPDPVERLTQMAIDMARERQRQANAIESLDKRKAAWAWAIKGEGRGRINNTLALARSVPPIADPGEHWDEDPFLLGAQNGVIDLRTGTWRKATPADRVTMRVRVAYDPAATCPLWLKTLSDIFAAHDLFTIDDSRSMIAFMQRAFGYSITGDCREECCFFTWGDGGNGKGTIMNTLGWLLGDYTDDMPYSTLERSDRGSGIPNDVAKLVGKRFITCAEVNEFNLNEARLKALTGRDPMTARFLHREFFTFIPVCKIWIATNNKPKIVGHDDGIWRRIHLVPFTRKFEGKDQNKQLKDQLRGELPGILNWIVEGARLWLRNGLNPPEAVRAATAAYRQESNPITPFVEACCVIAKNYQMQAALAFKEYEGFCRDQNVEPWRRLSNKAFFKAMEQVFAVDRSGRQTFYLGVGLMEKRQAATEPAPKAAAAADVDDSMAANPEEPEAATGEEPEAEVPF